MERLAEQPIIDKTDESTNLLGSTQGLNDNGEAVDTVRRIPFNLVAEALSKLGVFITVNESNIIGVTKNLGTFECVAIDDATNKYTFAVADTSIFVSSTEYKVTLDAVDYIVRTSKINEDTVVFVAVNDAVPFVVGNSYTIVFETVNATALGKGNTVLAHNALGAGYNNKIDETGDQSATFGYGHEVSGKNQMATGYNHDILGGEADVVIGSSNIVNGHYKLVAGVGLTSILTPNGATVLGKYNVDVENALFILGGGVDKNQRKNLIVVDKKGSTILNGTLDVNGDTALTGNFSINAVIKEVGEFECTDVNEQYKNYTFNTGNRTYIFQNSAERNCKITIDGVDYDVQINYAYYDTGITNFRVVDDELPPITKGNVYKIRIETKDGKCLSFVKNMQTYVFDMIFNGNASFNGDMQLNNSPVITERMLLGHSGVDVGAEGSGIHAVIFGSDTNIASGVNTFVTGAANTATNDQGTIFGYGNINHAKNALIMGLRNIIESGEGSVALGDNIRIYSKGAGIGTYLTVKGSRGGQTVVGRYNNEETEAVFIVGNGTSSELSNAFVIYADGSAKFLGDVNISGIISASQVKSDNVTVKHQVKAQTVTATEGISVTGGSISVEGSVTAKGSVTGSNIFPIGKTLTANGNITNADTGEIVAEYGGDGYVDFNIVEVSYGSGYDGKMIKNNKYLIAPITPVTLKAGTYKKYISCPYGFRLDECDFKVLWFDPTENPSNVIDNGDYYVFTDDVTISQVYFETDIADSDIPYNGTYRFHGSGVLSCTATMITDVTADLIGAAQEHIEADGISTSLHLTSPNGTVFKITVDDNGALKTTKI